MRLLLDARWIRPGKTGVGVFCDQMVRSLVELCPGTGLIIHSVNRELVHDIPAEKLEIEADLIDHPQSDFFEQWGLVELAKKRGFTHFISFEGRVPLFKRGLKTFSFIYDVASIRVPGSHGLAYSAYLKWCLWSSSQSADAVLTISETVKKHFMVAHPNHRNRVEVVFPGPTPWPVRSSNPSLSAVGVSDAPFFLAIGMSNPRKNFPALVLAFEQYRKAGGKCQLYVTGDKNRIQSMCQQAVSTGIHPIGYVDDSTLKVLFESCSGLVYPSLDEGFGIPLVDAYLFGKPVACSDIEVFREVMGEYPIYFDPRDTGEMGKALLEMERTSEVASRPRPPRAYGWRESAERLLKIVSETG
jgi:glycosyltransferase involved in cell wall biosynthesis